MLFGKCRLHLEESELQESHIIPRWVYTRLSKVGSHPSDRGGKILLRLAPDAVSADPSQLKEHLLCAPCERIIKPSEDYVSKVTWQLGGQFPALKAVEVLPQLFREDPELRLADGRKLDAATIAKFAASIFWRASVSSFYELRDCKLRKYEEDFRLYLRDEAPFPSCARLVVQLISRTDGLPLEKIAYAPAARRVDGHYHLYDFATFGMRFTVALGGEVPQAFHDVCLVRTRHVLVGTGHDLIGMVARMMMAPRKGKVAEGLPRPWEDD